MKRFFELFAKYLIVATFVMPLIVVPSSFIFPFIVPKILFFRSIAVLLLASLLILGLYQKKRYQIQFTPITIGVLLYLLSFTISTFVGVDWYRSFWDNHERMLGLFTIIHYIFFYIAATTIIRDKKDWQELFRWFLLFGGAVAVIGLLQKVQPDLLLNRGQTRVSATLGNAIYLSGYGLFLFALGIFTAIREQPKTFWFYYAVTGALLGFAGIFLGGTRGTFLGLLTGFGIAALVYTILHWQKKRIRTIGISLVIGLVAFVGLLFTFRNTAIVQNVPTFRRLTDINFEELGTNPRIMAWNVGIDSASSHLFFGWGPNNFFYAFNEFYRPEFLRHGVGETWFDNAHNVLVNTYTTQGVFGLLTYLALFGLTGYGLTQSYRNGRLTTNEYVILIAFFGAHFVHNIFVFENPASYLYFMFMLAVANSANIKHDQEKESVSYVSTPAIVITLLVAGMFLFVTNYRPAKANTASLRAIQTLGSRPDLSIDFYQQATSYGSPHIDDIHLDFSRNALQQLPAIAGSGQVELLRTLHEESTIAANKAVELHPRDIRSLMVKAQLLQVKANLEQNPQFLMDAVAVLEEIKLLSPKRQQLDYMLANIFFIGGRPDTAAEILREAINLDPKTGESWIQLVELYVKTDNLEQAVATITEANDVDTIFSRAQRNRIETIEQMYANQDASQ